MFESAITAVLARGIPPVTPSVVPVVDPRSTVELLIQAVGAIGFVVGGAIVTMQLISKQFGGENYAAADFRKGMINGVLWMLLGGAVIAVAIVLSPQLR